MISVIMESQLKSRQFSNTPAPLPNSASIVKRLPERLAKSAKKLGNSLFIPKY